MPMIDAVIPEDALPPEAETRLIKEVTDILIRAEGFDPTSAVVQRAAVAYLHRPVATYVGGARTTEPRYRITTSVPEGKYSDEAIKTLVREITEAFARAEGTSFEDIAPRVWIFPTEISEGRWGAGGIILGIAEIQARLAGEPQRPIGEQLLARRRRVKAREIIEATADAVRRGIGTDTP